MGPTLVAEPGNAQALYIYGLVYSEGEDVKGAQPCSIAASRFDGKDERDRASKARDAVAANMTLAQIAILARRVSAHA